MGQGLQVDANKLKALIVAHTGPGKPLSRRALSLMASDGRNPDLVRDLMRAGKQNPTIGAAAGICAALGKDLSEVVRGVQLATEAEEWLTVCQTVTAGVWREQTDWSPDDCYEVKIGLPLLDGDRYGAVVEGRSMERTIPPGTILECVKVIGSEIVPRDGDYVIVEKQQGALREITCKRLHIRRDGNYELHAESHQPEFADPIFIGKPADNYFADTETRIIAVAVRGVLRLFLPERRSAPPA